MTRPSRRRRNKPGGDEDLGQVGESDAGHTRFDKLGAFALTEPDHGSDSVALETTAREDAGAYVINGAKRWIGNGTVADVVVVWAGARTVRSRGSWWRRPPPDTTPR